MRSRTRGFTLVELLIALVVSSIVIGGALALFIGEQRVFQRSSADRAVQESARVALEELSSRLRTAGYGLEPILTFDFGPVAGVRQTTLPSGTATIPGYRCDVALTCRDSTTGPDEIVFYARDPSFMRTLASAPSATAGSGSLTLAGPLTSPLRKGQILQVAGYGSDPAKRNWAFVTVKTEVAADPLATTTTVPLEDGNANVFGFQTGVLSQPSFAYYAAAGAPATDVFKAAKVFKVDRYRYFIRSYDEAGAVQAWGTTGARPYLMLDQGLYDASGNRIEQVIASDVEDLQFVYLFPRSASATPALPILTADAAQLTNAAGGMDLGAAAPAFSDGDLADSRKTHSPANLSGVRVAIVVRQPVADTRTPGAGTQVPASANRAAATGPDGYQRFRYETTVTLRNLDIRGAYFPSYSTNTGDGLNVGGG